VLAASSVSAAVVVISGKSLGTFDEVTSLFLRCKRWDNLFGFADGDFNFSLVQEDAEETLRSRPLKNRLVRDFRASPAPLVVEGGLEESDDENVGGDIISWVFVSERMNVKTGSSSRGGTSRVVS
jgi:hypothetical protein